MSNADLFQLVKEMKLPAGQYALFGSTPMGARGLKDCRDADIIVSPSLWDEYAGRPGWQYHKAETGNESLSKGNIEIWRDWRPWFPETAGLISEAEIIDGLPFVRLGRVLEWKRKYGREKDLKDIATIEGFLASGIGRVRPGVYRHYKGRDYEVIGMAKHSETMEELVVYRALYGERAFWVRPASMFLEEVEANGVREPRFRLIEG